MKICANSYVETVLFQICWYFGQFPDVSTNYDIPPPPGPLIIPLGTVSKLRLSFRRFLTLSKRLLLNFHPTTESLNFGNQSVYKASMIFSKESNVKRRFCLTRV